MFAGQRAGRVDRRTGVLLVNEVINRLYKVLKLKYCSAETLGWNRSLGDGK